MPRAKCGGFDYVDHDRLLRKKAEGHRHPPGSARRRAEGDGSRPIRRRLLSAGHAVGQNPALAACSCPHPLDRHLESAGAARRQGGDDLRGPPRAEVRVCRPRASRREFLAHDAQHHGARESPLRGSRRRRRRRDQHDHRRRGAAADRSRLRGAAARHRRR